MLEFKHLQEALAQYAQAIADQYKQNLENSGRRASGKLISSVNSKVTVNGNEYAIELNLEDYWYYVENGRGAGKFPTENQLAYLIGRKIANEGFDGTKDLEHTMEEVDYETIIEEALAADVMAGLDEILTIFQ